MTGNGEIERLRAAIEHSVCATCGKRDNDFCSSAYHGAAQPDAERAPGAPGRGLDGKLICLCKLDRSYCPHTEGQCPWWDREPIDPEWSQPDAERAPQDTYDPERATITAERAPQEDRWRAVVESPEYGHAPDCGLYGDAECTCHKRRPERAPQGPCSQCADAAAGGFRCHDCDRNDA